MMDYMGNKVVFTGADFVMRPKALCRSTSCSGKTEATVSLSTVSSLGTNIANKPIDANSTISSLGTDIAIKPIANKPIDSLSTISYSGKADATPNVSLVSTLSSLGADIANKPIDSLSTISSIGTDNTNKTIDQQEEASKLLLRKVAKEILQSLQKNGTLISGEASKPSDDGSSTKTAGNSARDVELAALSDMILTSLEANYADGSDKHLLREGHEERECSIQASSGRSFAASKTNSTRRGSTESGLSGLTLNEQYRYKNLMDIPHPDFHIGEVGEDVGFDATDNVGGEIAVSDFLKGVTELSNERSDEDGLAGVFGDFPEGRRPSKSQVLETMALHSISASKDKIKTKNPVVSLCLRFDKIVVRNYDRILNDNPACTKGPSVGLGWDFVEQGFDIEDYEMERGRLRLTSELRLLRAQRERLVRDLGYTDREIGAAIRGANKIKSRRRQTIHNLKHTKMEEAVENAGRRVKRMLFLRSNDCLSNGYNEREIGAAVRGFNMIKSRRRQTIHNLGATKMEEAVENAGRRRMLFLRSNDCLSK
jgi:hypothetical protein